MAKYFPLLRNIENQNIVIIGNNQSAHKKAEKLALYGAKINFICSRICDIEAFFEENKPQIVIVADEALVNTGELFLQCQKRNAELNVVDRPELSTFIFPSLITTEHLTIAVSTDGKSPTASVKIREEAEKILPDNIDEIIMRLNEERKKLKSGDKMNQEELKEYLKKLADSLFEKKK